MSKEYIEETGFVLINGQLRTICCGICVIPHPTYDLVDAHLKASPNCPYIRRMYGEVTVREYVRIANVAMSDMRQEYALNYGVDVRCPEEVFPSDSQTFRKQFGQNSGRRYDTVAGIPLEKPRYPYYADEHNNGNRERTYSNPTAHAKEIRAGFFYDNDIRHHTCYQCGVRLILQEGDDPEFQHAALSPSCMHINFLKGRTFVKEVQELVQANSRRTQQDPNNCGEYEEIYDREAIVNVSSDDASRGTSGNQDVRPRAPYDPRGRSPRRGDPGQIRTNPRNVPRRRVFNTTRGQQHTKRNIRPSPMAREHQQQRSSGIGLNQEAERRCCQDPPCFRILQDALL